MNIFSTRRALFALLSSLLLFSESRADALSARVDLDGCVDLDRDEVRRLIGIELQASEPLDGAPLLHVSCVDGEAELRVRPPSGPAVVRTLDLASIPSSARARLLALAATELLAAAADPDPPPRPRPHKNPKPRSESIMFKRVLAGGLALLAAAAPASAARPAPRAPVELSAPQSLLAHPAPRKKDDSNIPALKPEDLFTAVGQKVHEITGAQIQIMDRLIHATSDNDPQKPELIFQWADLYAEQQRYHRFRARTLDQTIFDARKAGDSARAMQLVTLRSDEEKQERAAMLEAVKRYLLVADDPRFARYARLDEVLFELGHLLTAAGKEEAARGYFRRLIKDHPTSKYIPDAYLAFAEYYFETKNMENAIAFYEKVMEHPESPLAGFALYKKGLCHYNLGEFKQALGTFVAVIDRARTAPGPEGAKLALGREARKDTVRAYAQVGGPERAWPFFSKVGGDSAPLMLEQLAELYNSQGKFPNAARLYRQLMALQPASAKLCAWQSEVVKNTLSSAGARPEPEVVKELERLSAVYQSLRERRTAAPPAALAECRDAAAQTLRELATTWHKEGQTTQQTATLQAAAALYKAYLNQFKTDKEAYAISFYYGEVLYRLGQLEGAPARFCEAAPVYSEVVKMDNSPRAKYLNDAALAAVYAWKECLRLDDNPQLAERDEAPNKRHVKPQPKPIPDSWRKLIDSFDGYFKYVPNGPEFARLEYRKARLYYEFDHLKEAIPLFRDIAYKHADSEYAIYSADLLFDSYAQLEQKTELRASRDELCKAPLAGRIPDFDRRCRVIHAAILRDDAETLEAARDYKAAGDLYLQLASEFPDDPKLDEVIYDAAVNYQRARMIGLAVLAFQQLMHAKPDSPLAKKAVYMIGRNYQDIAAFEAAAENYESFASRWPGEKDASTALYSASFFRRGLGENQKAIDDAKLFIQNYGPRPEFTDIAAGVAFGEGAIFEQQRDWNRLEQHLKNYLRDWGARGGVDRALIAHVKLGEIAWRAACPVEGANGACVEVKRARRRVDARRAGATCGSRYAVTLHERKPAGVRDAQAHFAAALKLFQNGAAARRVTGKDEAERDARAREMAFFAAEARMLQGDAEYEKFLAMPLPDGLAFAPGSSGRAKARDAESRRRLAAWLQAKSRQLEIARHHYETVIGFKQAHWAIAAAARIGQLFQNFAAQINNAPVPIAPPPPPGVDGKEWRENFSNAFCDELGNHVVVLEDKAEDALKMCLDKSTDLSWFNEWSSLCEAELNQLKPATYPLASELRAEPGYLAAGTDRVAPRALPR